MKEFIEIVIFLLFCAIMLGIVLGLLYLFAWIMMQPRGLAIIIGIIILIVILAINFD